MNKYIETDISDGIVSINIGIQNIMASISKGEIKEYILKAPLDVNAIKYLLKSVPLKDFKNNILYYEYNNTTIGIMEYNKHCKFFNAQLKISPLAI